MTKVEFNRVIDKSVYLISHRICHGICETLPIHLSYNLDTEFCNLFRPHNNACGYWLNDYDEHWKDDAIVNRRLNALEIFRYNCLTYGTYKEF